MTFELGPRADNLSEGPTTNDTLGACVAPGATWRRRSRLLREVAGRLKGPGGFYNLGNLLGLIAGTAVHIVSATSVGTEGASLLVGIFDKFAGSPSAVALSLAMLVFFCSGEIYHRAWANGFPPDTMLNRRADSVSGLGAVALGVGLLITGHPYLAATSGLLHAGGKFGSAWAWTSTGRYWPSGWPDLWRSLVLASRMPALLASVLSLWVELSIPVYGISLITPVTLIICYLLWIKADLLLFSCKT